VKIAVLGHLCYDLIKHPDGNESRSYGGIFYSVGALANLLGPNDLVVPVFGAGKSDYDDVIELLNKYGNVDTSEIYRMNGPTNQVTLTYGTSGDRIECSKYISEPIPMKKIRPVLSVDMVLINMISGFDISLETLDEIRMEVREDRTPIYLDIHCLVCGVNPDFTRFYRPLDMWRRWLFMLHGVQMNEKESASMTNEVTDETVLARQVLALNTKVLHITRGSRGSTIFVDEHKQVKRFDILGVDPEKAVDSTGCGDVYAAAYCVWFLRSKEIQEAAQFANLAASYNARVPGAIGIDSLSELRSTLM
jgi:sugar/nucleoside kinase (ribokinase family)